MDSSVFRQRRRWIVLVAALLTLTFVPIGPLDAAATAQIKGVVTRPGGTPVIGVGVVADGGLSGSGNAITGADGSYTINFLNAGNYTVSFFPPTGSGLFPEWYNNATDPVAATPVVVTSGAIMNGISAELAPSAVIEGNVDFPIGVSGPATITSAIAYGTDGLVRGFTRVRGDGTYTLDGLTTGDYYLKFVDDAGWGINPEWYPSAMFFPTGITMVHADEGVPVNGINVALDLCAAPNSFSDVLTSNQFCGAIEWLTTTGIAQGYPDGTFGATKAISRAAMAAFLYRQAGSPDPPFVDPLFTDVPTSSPFFDEIAWLVQSLIAGGYPDGTYRPGAAISRQAMASFLFRAAGSPAVSLGSSCLFPDVCPAHPFFEPITWMTESGIAGGYADGKFYPGGAVSRQAMASFLFRQAEMEAWAVTFP